jgi:hypothetical protein
MEAKDRDSFPRLMAGMGQTREMARGRMDPECLWRPREPGGDDRLSSFGLKWGHPGKKLLFMGG